MHVDQILERMIPQNTQHYINVFDRVKQTGIANDVSMEEISERRQDRDQYAKKFQYYLGEHEKLITRPDGAFVSILARQERRQLQKILQITSQKYQVMLMICDLYQPKHDQNIVFEFEKRI